MEDIQLYDIREIMDEEVFEILDRYPDCILNNNNIFHKFDSSSTNIIIGINEEFVFKKKRKVENNNHIEWYEAAMTLLKCEKICDIYLKSCDDNFFEYLSENQYSLMNYYKGNVFQFGDFSQMASVKDFVNRLQHINIPSDLILNDRILLDMPKQEILRWFVKRNSFEKQFVEKIRLISTELSVDINPIMRLLDRMDDSNLKTDYHYLRKTLSHGEIQGQNLLFMNNEVCVVDWDSLSIRPAIYDIAMSACFLCRSGRGQFKINDNLFNSYTNSFALNNKEKEYLLMFLMIVFLPDISLVEEYYAINESKAKWYLEWSCNALKDINDYVGDNYI